jgi:YHS domain-containing protein
MAFIYADLIVIPIVLIYRKFYGWKITWRIVAIMFVTMVAAALIVDGIFSAAGLVPTERPSIDSITNRGIEWNYTTALNIVAFVVFGLLFALTLRRGAKDPVCGMTVNRTTPYTSSYHGRTVYFCSAHCKARFDADPESFLGPAGGEVAPLAHAGGQHRH